MAKIRTSFVSNSSTTSFLVYGISIEESKINSTKLNELIRNTGLESYWTPCSTFVVGMSWDAIGDNETGSQFKERVKSKLTEASLDPTNCSTHQEAWYDG